jgi:hypothetical protein
MRFIFNFHFVIVNFPTSSSKLETILKIIIWWEIRRIPYNVIMLIFGYLSLFISYVNIPVVYLVFALMLNLIYNLGWIVEIVLIKNLKNENIRLNYPRYAFRIYLALSIMFVFALCF